MRTFVPKTIVVLCLVVSSIAASQIAVAVPPPMNRPPVSAPTQLVPPLVSPAPLRAAPLPPDTLQVPSPFPARSTYSMPYGPNFTRPSGRPIMPFGSSGYYYRGYTHR